MQKFKTMPYWIHLTIDTIVGQVIWCGASKMLKTPIEIQSVIAGLILIATIFAVAWYIPKWGNKEQKFIPTKIKPDIYKRTLTLEEVAAQSAFVRSLKALAQRLTTNTNGGSHPASASQILDDIYGNTEVASSEQAKKHPIIAQAYDLLKKWFDNLENEALEFKDVVDKFTSILSSDDIKRSCNNVIRRRNAESRLKTSD